MTFLVLAVDLIVKNPHYAACMLLEEGSWEWWLKACFIYDTASSAALIGSVALAGFFAVMLRSLRQPGGPA